MSKMIQSALHVLWQKEPVDMGLNCLSEYSCPNILGKYIKKVNKNPLLVFLLMFSILSQKKWCQLHQYTISFVYE